MNNQNLEGIIMEKEKTISEKALHRRGHGVAKERLYEKDVYLSAISDTIKQLREDPEFDFEELDKSHHQKKFTEKYIQNVTDKVEEIYDENFNFKDADREYIRFTLKDMGVPDDRYIRNKLEQHGKKFINPDVYSDNVVKEWRTKYDSGRNRGLENKVSAGLFETKENRDQLLKESLTDDTLRSMNDDEKQQYHRKPDHAAEIFEIRYQKWNTGIKEGDYAKETPFKDVKLERSDMDKIEWLKRKKQAADEYHQTYDKAA